MKKKSLLLLALPFAIIACNNESKDSVEKADSTNEVKADTMNNLSDTTNTNKGGTMAVDQSTADFMVKVADVGMTEVKLEQMAQDKGTNQRVKNFGSMMVKDHSQAGDELKRLARNKNVTLPATPGDDHQKKIDDLDKKTGKDFDKAYMSAMVGGHQSAVNDFEKNTDNKDPDVKAWVDKTLPTLKMHLDSAKAIKKAIQ